MAENKTMPTGADVDVFLAAVPDAQRRADALELRAMFQRITGEEPVMWGASMIGFGSYRYRYESGREGEWLATGFSPRARELVLYLMADAPDREALLQKLGKHRTGKSCLYIKRLSDVDREVLETLVRRSLEALRRRYPDG